MHSQLLSCSGWPTISTPHRFELAPGFCDVVDLEERNGPGSVRTEEVVVAVSGCHELDLVAPDVSNSTVVGSSKPTRSPSTQRTLRRFT
jgi:hypothetical protein